MKWYKNGGDGGSTITFKLTTCKGEQVLVLLSLLLATLL